MTATLGAVPPEGDTSADRLPAGREPAHRAPSALQWAPEAIQWRPASGRPSHAMRSRRWDVRARRRSRIHRLVVAALVTWLAIAVVGAILQAFLVTLVALALVLGTGAAAEATHPPTDRRSRGAVRIRRSRAPRVSHG
jgi:hypothetical protein